MNKKFLTYHRNDIEDKYYLSKIGHEDISDSLNSMYKKLEGY